MLKCQFSDLRERDMDLLLMEEIASCQEFANIFLSLIGLADAEVISVEQSKTDENGESDITVIVTKDSVKYGLLIEDKIDAEAQPAQAVRYRKRGDDGVKNGEYCDYKTFIVAPQTYLENNTEADYYDYQVTYEQCLEYFRDLSDSRAAFKSQQIMQAIDKQKSGYQPIINDAVTDFWRQYRQHQKNCYPDIKMLGDKDEKPSKSTWMYFETNFKKVHIIHKSAQGLVDMEFTGLGDQWQELRSLCQTALGNLYEQQLAVEKTNKSAVLRSLKAMRLMDVHRSFSEQRDVADIALTEVHRLRKLLDELPTAALCALWDNATT